MNINDIYIYVVCKKIKRAIIRLFNPLRTVLLKLPVIKITEQKLTTQKIHLTLPRQA